MMDEYYEAIRLLPQPLQGALAAIPPARAGMVHEIRLRAGEPVQFTVAGRPVAAAAYSPETPALRALRVPPDGVEAILYALCGGSVHSHEGELARGFFTLPGGHRVGVGGVYLYDGDGHPALQQAESLNIRVARQVRCALPPELRALLAGHFTGLLLLGEPDSGKTTLLRSILAFLRENGRTAAVIDARQEILPPRPGQVGPGCDRIAGLDKATAVEMALRTLGPQVLLLDELGAMEEVYALERGFFGGVDVIATLHAASFEEAEHKPQVQYLRRDGMLRHACLLAGRQTPGRIAACRSYS